MKIFYTLAFSAFMGSFCTNNVVAQNNIKLDLKHMLLEDDFALFQEASTPDDIKFNLDRLEYYISEIKVTHDGGQTTQFQDLWLLVNATENSMIDLDTASIDSVESIAFSVGVDQAHNHLDPSSWPSNHPLAPQNPSMHWGWTAGYRFVAMEGMGGNELDQVFEVHALDDNNYFETTVNASTKAENGDVVITVYADYTKALNGIDVSSGIISHGSTGPARTLLQNFKDYVFSSEAPIDTSSNDTTVSVVEVDYDVRVTAAPNPSIGSSVRLLLDNLDPQMLSITAFDLTGKQIATKRVDQNGIVELNGFNKGLYIIQVTDKLARKSRTLKVTVLP